MKWIILVLALVTQPIYGATSKKTLSQPEVSNKEDVVDNPTLKVLSGSLNKFSFYSSFVYRGGSLDDPTSPERPNILKAEETPGLASLSGNFGLKYRMSKSDNISLQLGLYSTTPFHANHTFEDAKNQKDFDENSQNVDVDDPTLSYFKTYYLGPIQNITFLKYQYVTRGIYRDYGLSSAISLSHAAAYRIKSYFYVAFSLTYENYFYDKKTTNYQGFEISLLPYQTKEKLRANFSTEFYFSRSLSLRFITDLVSYYRMKGESDIQRRGLQQTIAMTYFYNRDISIAPNIRFVAEDLSADRTNVGLTLNVNL